MSDSIELKDVIVTTARFGFDKGSWHPTLLQATGGLTPQQASWKPAPERNSIHEIVRHLTHWKKMILNNWAAMKSQEAFRAYAAQDWQLSEANEAAWEQDLAELASVSNELLEKIQQTSEADLARPIGGRGGPEVFQLLNVATHDSYHAGQIMYIRKLQGL